MSIVVTLPTEELRDDVRALIGDADARLELWTLDEPLGHTADIVVPPYLGTGYRRLQHLAEVRPRLVQSQSIGYDDVVSKLPEGLRLANAATVHETATAEIALALALAALREIPRYVRLQDEGRWERVFSDSLADRRALVIGWGGVGKAIGARLAPFEVEVVPVASRARTEDGVDIHGIDEIDALLPDAELVVLAVPANDASRHLLDEERFALLRDGTLVVNVGRGSAIDTEAMLRHAGRIRFGLDVTDPEPLPENHPLWKAEGVLITPHVGGAAASMRPRIARLVARQIMRMLDGVEPENVVYES